jgi:hypothetical protein
VRLCDDMHSGRLIIRVCRLCIGPPPRQSSQVCCASACGSAAGAGWREVTLKKKVAAETARLGRLQNQLALSPGV